MRHCEGWWEGGNAVHKKGWNCVLKYILFDTTCFESADDREQTEKDLCFFMESLTQRNQSYLSRRPNTPRIYKSGVVWEKPKQLDGDVDEIRILKDALGRAAKNSDVKNVLDKISMILGGEHFCDIGVILELGKIDCDGLACWRAAELRQAGITAKPMMTSRKRTGGGITYHAIVRWPPFGDALGGNPNEDTDEDPSLLLGMAQPQRAMERNEEIRKNKERFDFIRRCQARGVQPFAANYNSVLEDVLGYRRQPTPSYDQLVAQLLDGRNR